MTDSSSLPPVTAPCVRNCAPNERLGFEINPATTASARAAETACRPATSRRFCRRKSSTARDKGSGLPAGSVGVFVLAPALASALTGAGGTAPCPRAVPTGPAKTKAPIVHPKKSVRRDIDEHHAPFPSNGSQIPSHQPKEPTGLGPRRLPRPAGLGRTD